MRDANRVGGVASLVQAIFFLIIPVVFLLVLPRLGLTLAEQGDPAKLLAFSTKNSLLMWIDAAMVIAAAAFVVLALVMQDRLRDVAPFAMRTAVIAASIGAALLLASGIADIYDLAAMRPAYAAGGASATMATTAYAGVGTVAVGLFWAGLLAYGVWVIMASWVALQAHRFAPALNYIGIAWGILAVLSVLAFASPTLYMLSLIVPILGLIWAAWLAYDMLRQSAPVGTGARVARQRPAAPTA